MITLSKGITAPENMQLNEKQIHLEKLFYAVDQIKNDLTTCGKGLEKTPTSDEEMFICNEHSFKTSYLKNGKKVQVRYEYDADMHIITRQVNKRKTETLLENVTGFFISFFPDSNSVLYRIEVNEREQVRGYIYMSSMVREEVNE